MTSYNLDVTSVEPLSKSKPRQAIVLCHGYGGDGKDISVLAINWQRFLPDAIFLCPNAPEVCNDNPQGYQWFDLRSDNEKTILLFEQAAANDSFDKREIFDIYEKFLFNINQFLNVKEVYKTLPKYKARALIYQSILLTDNIEKKLLVTVAPKGFLKCIKN